MQKESIEMAKMGQFISSGDIKLVDKDAGFFVLADGCFDRIDIKEVINDRYVVLHENSDPIDYVLNKQNASKMAWKWTIMIGSELNKRFGLQLDDTDWMYTLHFCLRYFFTDFLSKNHKLAGIKDEEFYIKRYYFEPRFRISNELCSHLAKSSDYHSFIWGSILSYYGKEEYILNKNTTPENKTEIIKRWTKLLQYNPRGCFTSIKNRAKRIYPKLWMPTGTGEICVIGSRMPKSLEQKIVNKSNDRIEIVDVQPMQYYTDKILSSIRYDEQFRREVFDNLLIRDEFDYLIAKILRIILPISLCEGYAALFKHARIICNKWNYRKIYDCSNYTDLTGFCWGIMKKKGCQICEMQHAMVYSLVQYVGYDEYETFDRFLTWGWENDGFPFDNIYAVGMTRQPSLRVRNCEKKDKILLLTSSAIDLTSGCHGFVRGEYINNQKRFIDALSNENRKKLVIRSDMNDSESDLRLWCNKKYPEIRFEGFLDISLIDSAAESLLVINDNHGSAQMEVLLNGIPVVTFEAEKVVKYNKACEELFSRMRDAKVLFFDGVELAEEISKHKYFGEWLNNVNIQSIFNEYVNVMTRMDQDLSEAWYNEFIS